MALLPTEIDDLVTTTYDTVWKKKKWVDLSQDKQFFTIADRYFRGSKMPMRSGPNLAFSIQHTSIGNTRYTAPYDDDQYGTGNQFAKGYQPWAQLTNNYTYDVTEQDFQSDDEMVILDYILGKEHGMYNDWFNFLENAFWTAPASSSVRPTPITGIPFWVQKNATEGFNGGDPSGFSGGAGNIATGTYSRWKNYTGTFGGINRDDFVAKVRRARKLCNFQPAHSYPAANADPKYVFYTTESVEEGCAKYLDYRKDNIGTDMGGTVKPMFQGFPIEWVPALTGSSEVAYDSQNPFYGINWSTFVFAFLRGKEMVRSGPMTKDGQHNVRAVHVDATCQLICNDRRSNFVLYQASA
jgi:hypothetical protein